jgi:hypothetical protein
MRAVERVPAPGPPSHLAEYRLGPSTCFLKICRPELDLGASELSKGMYMDLDLWALALHHLAPSGNPALRFDRDLRYLKQHRIHRSRSAGMGRVSRCHQQQDRFLHLTALRSRHSVRLAAAMK